MSAQTLTITGLGDGGDGLAPTDEGPVFVPFTLPGESVLVAREGGAGTLMALKEPSPERVAPPCRHFGPDGAGGTCGGCQLQHMSERPYLEFKRQRVLRALAGQGIEAKVDAPVPALPGDRRRVVLSARREGRGVVVGFAVAGSHRIVPIAECPVASERITAHLPVIRELAEFACPKKDTIRISVLASASGLDIAASGCGRIAENRRLRLVEAALARPVVARLTVENETIVEARRPVIHYGRAAVTPPAGGFVQASGRAEAAMADLVRGHLAGARTLADLFCGSGAFTLRLAEQAAVHAVETDAQALEALDAAVRTTKGLKPVTTERRDLFKGPMMARDLKNFDGLVFDPPRAGAKAQAGEIALSAVPRVAAVSCNPATLARDLSILLEGGYKLLAVQPVDQFLWSPHIEVVALLER